MKLTTKSFNYSRDHGYFLLEQGTSSTEDFNAMEEKLSTLDHVQVQSGEDDWTDFTFDKFYTSFEEIKEVYKSWSKEE